MPKTPKTTPNKVATPIRQSQRRSAGKLQGLEPAKHAWSTEGPSKEDKYMIGKFFDQEFKNPHGLDDDQSVKAWTNYIFDVAGQVFPRFHQNNFPKSSRVTANKMYHFLYQKVRGGLQKINGKQKD